MMRKPSFEDRLLWHIQLAIESAISKYLEENDLREIIKEVMKEIIQNNKELLNL